MNDLISRLAEQAWIETSYPGSCRVVREWSKDKFAELIIMECISTLENADNGYQDYRNQIEDGMRNYCIGLLKQKLGVEDCAR